LVGNFTQFIIGEVDSKTQACNLLFWCEALVITPNPWQLQESLPNPEVYLLHDIMLKCIWTVYLLHEYHT